MRSFTTTALALAASFSFMVSAPAFAEDKMSNDDAYAIVKTLVEKKADIVAVHKEAESFSLDNQVHDRSPIPFHPGALKYFKEKGIGG